MTIMYFILGLELFIAKGWNVKRYSQQWKSFRVYWLFLVASAMVLQKGGLRLKVAQSDS